MKVTADICQRSWVQSVGLLGCYQEREGSFQSNPRSHTGLPSVPYVQLPPESFQVPSCWVLCLHLFELRFCACLDQISFQFTFTPVFCQLQFSPCVLCLYKGSFCLPSHCRTRFGYTRDLACTFPFIMQSGYISPFHFRT